MAGTLSPRKLPQRLTTHRFLVNRAHNRAEAAYFAGAKAAYAAGWDILKTALQRMPVHDVAKAAGDPADDAVLASVRAAMIAQLTIGATKASAALAAGENEWFKSNGFDAAQFTPIEDDELMRAYQAAFAHIGGFKGIADSATEPIQQIIRDYYADPNLAMPDLVNSLQTYFSPYKAQQVAATEVTRMSSCNAQILASRVGAQRWEWDSANDAIVCSACADLDGQKFDFDGDEEPPPDGSHVGCRCRQTVLVVDDDE